MLVIFVIDLSFTPFRIAFINSSWGSDLVVADGDGVAIELNLELELAVAAVGVLPRHDDFVDRNLMPFLIASMSSI